MRRAAIVSPLRTPVGKYLGTLNPLNAEDLGAMVIRALIERTGVDPERIEEVVFAQGYPSGEAP
ncbi:MAG: acetyl-CoA C-acyltransferase, partial [Pseudomonadales bacterium]|nr:acetyl-CoA C-acyltransferase [Pseudomonadales bacterium]